ncbi:MAG: T9SS type A sorting domain-containing protein [Bacteroidota bacterium]
MKKIILFVCCILNITVYAQQWEWAKTVDINLPINLNGEVRLATDKVGNFYLSYINWDSNSGNPDGATVAKYDFIGNKLWQKDFTTKMRIKDIASDSFGALYIAGDFRDTILVDNVSLISNGYNDAFLAKFNSSGNLQWIKKSGGLYNDSGSGLCLDTKGNIYMTGEHSDGNWNYGNVSNMTVSKFDSSGNLLLFKSSNTPLQSFHGFARGEKIKLDNFGNILVLGSFSFLMQIDTLSLNDGSIYGAQFICKLDTAGQIKWLKQTASSSSELNDFILGDDNTIFATGERQWTNGSWTITKRLDIFGNSLWNQGCGLHCGYYSDGTLNGIANDSTNIIVYGDGSCHGLLLVKYAFDGSLVYLDTIHAINYIKGKSIVRDLNGKYLISGFIQGAIKLGSDSIYSSTNKIFIAKFSDNASITSIKNQGQIFELLKVFPNPSSGVFTVDMYNHLEATTIVVRDVLGNCLFEKNCRNEASPTISLSNLTKGIYFIEIVSEEIRSVNKIVVQ